MKRLKNKDNQLSKKNFICNKLLHDRQGMTLVEMIVTFALLSMLMVSVSQVIASGFSLYNHIKGVSYGKQVCDTLMEKITGEIEGAQADYSSGDEVVGDSPASDYITISALSNSSNTITLRDRTRSKIRIELYNSTKNNNDYLNVYYFPVYSQDSNGENKTRFEEVNWTFDNAMYMGYSIKSLSFSLAKDEDPTFPGNVIKVQLSITSDRYGDYSQTRYVECYNFEEDDWNKITGGESENENQETDIIPEELENEKNSWEEFIKDKEINNKNGSLQTLYKSYYIDSNNSTKVEKWRPYPVFDSNNKYMYTIYFFSNISNKDYTTGNDSFNFLKDANKIMIYIKKDANESKAVILSNEDLIRKYFTSQNSGSLPQDPNDLYKALSGGVDN